MIRNEPKTMLKKFPRTLRIPDFSRSSYWPSHVLDILETKYKLRPDDMLRLWYIIERVKNGKYYREYLYIYDRVKAQEKNVSIRSSDDLYDNPDLLVFTGNIFWDGSVYLKRVNNSENN